MKHTWIKNTDPLCRPHRRCDSCALIEEVSGGIKIYHRGGQDVATVSLKSRQPPCK